MKTYDFPESELELMVDSISCVPGDKVVIRFTARSMLRVVFLVPRNLPTDVDVELNGKNMTPRHA